MCKKIKGLLVVGPYLYSNCLKCQLKTIVVGWVDFYRPWSMDHTWYLLFENHQKLDIFNWFTNTVPVCNVMVQWGEVSRKIDSPYQLGINAVKCECHACWSVNKEWLILIRHPKLQKKRRMKYSEVLLAFEKMSGRVLLLPLGGDLL